MPSFSPNHPAHLMRSEETNAPMYKGLPWLFWLELMLALALPGPAWADAPLSTPVIGNGQVALGVGPTAGLDELGTGVLFTDTRVDGVLRLCACNDWSL